MSLRIALEPVVPEIIPVTINSFAVASLISREPPNVPPMERFPPTTRLPEYEPSPSTASPITPRPLPRADAVEPTPTKLVAKSSPPNVEIPVFLI